MTEADLLSCLKQAQTTIFKTGYQIIKSSLKDGKQISFIGSCSSYLLETISRLWCREEEPGQNLASPLSQQGDLCFGKTKPECTRQSPKEEKTTQRKNSRDLQGVPAVYPAE